MKDTRTREKDLRLPDWQPGADVMLCDGQVWTLPRPRLVYRMRAKQGGGVEPFTDGSRQSETYAALLDQLDKDQFTAGWYTSLAGMALDLLREQYTIPDELIPELFVVEPGSEVNVNVWAAIHNAVTGLATYNPKR